VPVILAARTDDTLAWTGAIAQNAGVAYDLVLPSGLFGVNGNALTVIKSLQIVSVQNLAWELWVYKQAAGQQSDPQSDQFAGFWSFAATDGKQIAGAGLFYYYIDGLEVPYRDLDFKGKLHMILVNRSVTSKNAGATGNIVVQVGMQPMNQMTG
jgi:hypothetical protein